MGIGLADAVLIVVAAATFPAAPEAEETEELLISIFCPGGRIEFTM